MLSGRKTRVTVRSLSEADETFREQWNAAISGAEWGHLAQCYEFAVLKNRTGWKPIFLGVETSDQLLAGALVLVRTLLGRYPILATVPSGPFWRAGCEAALEPLFRELERCLQRCGVALCRVAMCCPVEVFEKLRTALPRGVRLSPHVWSYWNPSRAAMYLDITGRQEDVLQRMHSDTRNKCRRGPRRGVSVRVGGAGDAPAMAALLRATARRKTILTRDEGYLRDLIQAFPRDRLAMILAEAQGETVAGVAVAALGDWAWYLYGGFDHAKRHLYPMESLYLAMIDWARERGCRTLDLGGTCTDWPPSETDKGYGVYAFKRRFGAQAFLRAPYCDILMRPFAYPLLRLAEDVILPLLLETGGGKLRVIRRRLFRRCGPNAADIFVQPAAHE